MMKTSHCCTPLARVTSPVLLVCLLTAPVFAGSTDLADKPLANATTVDILPNIFFILDDSGSMNWDFMPDYVEGNYCRDNYTEDGDTNGDLDLCRFGDPPFMTSTFNRVYYNPNVNYTAPINADGSSRISYATWTAVPLDGYGIQFTSTGSYPRDNNVYSSTTVTPHDWAYGLGTTINLTTQFPERKWCTSGSNSTTCSSNTVTALNASNQYAYPDSTHKYLRTVYGYPYYYNVSLEWCSSRNTTGADKNFGKAGTCQSKKTSTYRYPRFSNWTKVTISPSTTTYPGPNGTTRTYSEEMTNFANWFAWYRTRMQMTKSGVGQAFANVRGTPNSSDATDQDKLHARVGFTTISYDGTTDGSRYLAINNFDSAQKNTWYARLYNSNPTSSTPLRAALAKAGQIYAGVKGVDPIQYSCQRNFTILSTDGYWNTNLESSTYGPYKPDGSAIGDQDGSTSVTRPSYDSLGKSPTLADISYYYYATDLRPGTCSVCTNNVTPAGTNANEDDVAPHQHMTTFTIGLGVDGTLAYQDGYKTSTSGDYYSIKQGTKNWPDPINNSQDERIDDLWHAAVNGRGTYFSARDPESLVTGLQSALGAAEQKTGSGAAAATSNLQPTSGDNYIYIANYRTIYWDGELSAYTINTSSGAISTMPVWQASTLLDAKVGSTGDTDSRTIYTSAGGALKPFAWASLTGVERAYFDETKLSQYADWTSSEKAASTGETMVNYLRGHHRYEDQDRDAGFGSYYRLYRDRQKTLGDIVHAQPVFVKVPFYNFGDSGYSGYKTAQAGRSGTAYVAANDGMLHAFDESGNERWAYIPPTIMKNLWRLADKSYSNNHRFFVDGPVAVSDIYSEGWKTILVGSLGKGGRGYYALDITNPASPTFLWTYTADNNPNLGYTYGTPMITKLNGTWVVLIPSGYNNVPESDGSYPGADGKGYLYALNAATGALIQTWATGKGSAGSPSGLATINIKVADFQSDNTMLVAYGGDLLGNMFRFNTDGTVGSVIDLTGSNQSITAAPEIGEIDGKTVLYFGTGRYLGEDDLSSTYTQYLYAVKDKTSSTSSTANMVSKTISGTTVTGGDVDWASKDGWYAQLPITGERVNLSAQLYFGTVIFASTVPTATACQPGGYGRLYYLDYKSGGNIESNAAVVEYTSPIVGFTVAKLPGGTPKVYPITADGGFPKGEPPTLPISSGGGGSDSGRRVMWRELVN